jgi:hypothetical protein
LGSHESLPKYSSSEGQQEKKDDKEIVADAEYEDSSDEEEEEKEERKDIICAFCHQAHDSKQSYLCQYCSKLTNSGEPIPVSVSIHPKFKLISSDDLRVIENAVIAHLPIAPVAQIVAEYIGKTDFTIRFCRAFNPATDRVVEAGERLLYTPIVMEYHLNKNVLAACLPKKAKSRLLEGNVHGVYSSTNPHIPWERVLSELELIRNASTVPVSSITLTEKDMVALYKFGRIWGLSRINKMCYRFFIAHRSINGLDEMIGGYNRGDDQGRKNHSFSSFTCRETRQGDQVSY